MILSIAPVEFVHTNFEEPETELECRLVQDSSDVNLEVRLKGSFDEWTLAFWLTLNNDGKMQGHTGFFGADMQHVIATTEDEGYLLVD